MICTPEVCEAARPHASLDLPGQDENLEKLAINVTWYKCADHELNIYACCWQYIYDVGTVETMQELILWGISGERIGRRQQQATDLALRSLPCFH